jgi:selenocysteine lyase/cysteine desulfurase
MQMYLRWNGKNFSRLVPVPKKKEKMKTTRRDFLKLLGGAAVTGTAALTLPQTWPQTWVEAPTLPKKIKEPTYPSLPPSSLPEEKWWAEIRKNFALDKNVFHFNTGTTGSLPVFAQENLALYVERKSATPGGFGSEFPNITTRRQLMADYIGANIDEVFISYNDTDATHVIYNGLVFEEGDEILTDPWQHANKNGNMNMLRQRYGVVIKVIVPPFPPTSIEEVVSAYEAGITPKTKACQFALIPQNPCVVWPAKEICTMLRSYGVTSLIDAAQCLGHVPFDVHDIGVDFMDCSGHKFLCGPAGTGIGYIRNSFNKDIWPLHDYWQGRNYGYGGNLLLGAPRVPRGDYNLGAALQQYGEANTPCMFAMADCAEFWNAIGRERIWNRLNTLGSYFKAKVAERWGPQAVLSDHPDFNTGFTYINPFTDHYVNTKLRLFATALTQRGVYNSANRGIRVNIGPDPSVIEYGDMLYGSRVATHFPFCGLQELDDLVDIMDEIVQELGGP